MGKTLDEIVRVIPTDRNNKAEKEKAKLLKKIIEFIWAELEEAIEGE